MSALEAFRDTTFDPRRLNVCTLLSRLWLWLIDFLIQIFSFLSFKDFFASVQRASKRDNNNRTPGEGTCFELGKSQKAKIDEEEERIKRICYFSDNFSLPENTSRSCWPVRPIPRRNFLHDISNGGTDQSHAGGTGGAGTSLSANAAIGVVIPTTPNSTLHQQQNQLNEQLLQQNQHLLMHRVPDGAPQPTRNFTAVNNTNNNHPVAINGDNGSAANVEERLSQIQDYIRITTTLIDSINNEKVGTWIISLLFCSGLCLLEKLARKKTTLEKKESKLIWKMGHLHLHDALTGSLIKRFSFPFTQTAITSRSVRESR